MSEVNSFPERRHQPLMYRRRPDNARRWSKRAETDLLNPIGEAAARRPERDERAHRYMIDSSASRYEAHIVDAQDIIIASDLEIIASFGHFELLMRIFVALMCLILMIYLALTSFYVLVFPVATLGVLQIVKIKARRET